MTVSKPNMINVNTPLGKYASSGKKRSKTTKIAWHYTGQADIKGKNTVYNWFLPIAQGKIKSYASAHFVCDLDGTIYSMISMPYVAYTTNDANAYSIGVECATTGSDDHYSDKEYVSMVKLGAWLAQYYGLDPRKDFIRHYDVTKKVCPRYFVNNSAKWTQFKLDCYNYMKGNLKEANIRNCTNGKGNSIVSSANNSSDSNGEEFKQYIIRVTADTLNGRSGPGTNYDVVTKLYEGTAVTIVEEKGNWLRTKMNYWIHKNYVKFVRYI